MNIKIIFLPVALLFAGCLVGCEDAAIPVYTADDFISFKPDKNNTKLSYSFLGTPSAVVKDTVAIELNLVGHVTGTDREVAIAVADTSTAKQGVDFDIIRPILLKKGTIKTHVQVVIFRTDALRETSRTIWLTIADSETLKKAAWKGNQFEAYKIEFSEDMGALQEPLWWPNRFSMFKYSKPRHLQYINEIGSSEDPTEAMPGLSQGDSYYFVLYKLQMATQAYNDAHDEPLADENGPISWEL